ncbi:DNA polymerase III subunit beta [Helicobacter muridarum]|nr:DNA polymerase III subunit beta [Helicobacter muridarum]STQ85247.1 DNA polymerase III subunit beta [Helicobacter muridarum]
MNATTIDKESLDKALSSMQNVIYRKNKNDLASNVFIETIEDKFILKSTDYEMSIRISLKIKEKQGELKSAIDFSLFSNIIKALNDDNVIIELKDNYINFKQGKSRFKMPVMEYGNEQLFATLDYNKMEKLNIDSNPFLSASKKAVHACSEKEIINIALQGILLEIKNNEMNLVATDTKRLAYIKQKYEQETKDIYCLIPKKAINHILKHFSENFDIYLQRGIYNNEELIEYIAFVSENTELYVKPINAKYPSFEFLLKPRENEHKLSLNKIELMKALIKMNVTNRNSKITFNKEFIKLETLDSDVEQINASIEIPCNLDLNEDITIGVSNRHLIECLSASSNENIEINIATLDTPILIDMGDIKEVIMPQIV